MRNDTKIPTQESPVLLIIGTRPEGIKMAPVYFALKRAGIPVKICSTMQHDHLLQEVLDVFGIVPDVTLNIMRPKQDLFYLTQSVLQKTKETFIAIQPSLVLVQGDTTSSMAAGLAAFYLGIPLGHVEAGLRTDDINSPFPEEMNRRLLSMISRYHFAPTSAAVQNLLAHGVHHHQIFYTGNTVVDALHIVRDKIACNELEIREDIQNFVKKAKQSSKKIGLLTVHRRESFNGALVTILSHIKTWAQQHPDVIWFYPYHPNPYVIEAIKKVGLTQLENLHLCEPVSYKDLVYLLTNASMVLTDSGGIQEEAVSLGIPVLVLREKTERMEGILSGGARLVGSDLQAFNEGMMWALQYTLMMNDGSKHVYGDGHAAEKIVAFIQSCFDTLQHERHDLVSLSQEEHFEIEKRNANMKKVCVVGLGYIGLPTAIVAAESGYNVVGFDIDEQRVLEINSGNPIIHEPEAYEKLQYVLGTHNFKATTDIESSDFYIVAVPTPITPEKTADLSYVYAAVDSIISVLKKDDVVILESTIPVGATEKIAEYITKKTGFVCGVDFYIAHCPERVLPGHIFYELVANDRIIGGVNQESVEKAKEFYKPFVSGRLYLTNATAAEMVKLVENSSRDVELAFAHQVASMAYAKGLDPYEIIALANKHPRVNILRPTCGVGGHCIAVDPWFLIESFPEYSQLLQTARRVNDQKPQEVIACVLHEVHEWRKHNNGVCKLLLLGTSYKPNVEDIRESPALYIAQQLVSNPMMHTMVCDPHVEAVAMQEFFGDRVVSSLEGIQQADIIVFLVAHDRFKVIDRKLLMYKKVIDYCGVFQNHAIRSETSTEEMFWPARSVMDFFIVNQSKEGVDSK